MGFRVALALLLVASEAANPLAPHILVVVQPGKEVVVRLTGYDLDGDKLKAEITSVPASGTLAQLSAVFSDYGYEPKAGTAITAAGVTVTGSNNRLVYRRPANDVAPDGKWAQFTYTVSDARSTSLAGTVTLVPPSGVLVSSYFTHGADGWTVEGNVGTSALAAPVSWEPSSRGEKLNRYVYATDSIINVDAAGDDATLWYFAAPGAFLGQHGMAYGGSLEFSLAAFSGEFDAPSANAAAHLVELECATCDTNAGVTLAYPVAALAKRFDGSPTAFSLPLLETAAWVKDPKNTLKTWWRPSKCEMIEVLSGLSAVRILGDFSRWYESVALDGVQFVQRAGASLVPVCAQGTPDASVCTCD